MADCAEMADPEAINQMGGSSSSRRQILRSSSIIAGASGVNLLIGLLRVKVAAVALGPAGVGLLGLMQNFLSVATVVLSLGVANAGTRQVAEAAGANDPSQLAAARRALLFGTAALALFSCLGIWLSGPYLAPFLFNGAVHPSAMAWLAVGVALSIAGGSLNGLLTGLRRIGDLARASVFSSVASTMIALPVLLVWRADGIPMFVLVTPLSTFLFGLFYASRRSGFANVRPQWRRVGAQWRSMTKLGLAMAVSGIAATGGEFLTRLAVHDVLGTVAVGHFQAAWMISFTYLSFVIAAMGSEYYPRLTAASSDHAAMNRMANEQSEVALLLAGPVLLGIMAMAPWVIRLLYSGKFTPAAAILQWQIIGDLFKVASFPLAFMLLALGRGRTFMATDLTGTLVLVATTWALLPGVGLQATGLAFLSAYAIYLPAVYYAVSRRTGFGWDRAVVVLFLELLLALITVFLIGRLSPTATALVGVPGACGLAVRNLSRLQDSLPAPIGRVLGSVGRFARPGRLSQ